ncbi:MAG: sulfatase [Candidatus Aminicenantes bacterium]|nr:sulfatase [Candidatus Aminicenantes bacterium]
MCPALRNAVSPFVLAAVLAAAGGGCRRPGGVVKEYSFISHLPEAVSLSESDRTVFGFQRFVVDWEGRDAVFQHPDSRIEFRRIPIGPKAKLKFGIGMDQGCWFLGGDGAQFEVVCRIGHSEKTLFSKYIDPKNNAPDRRWHDVEIDLSRYEGRVASFVFRTTGGPRRNTMHDMAGWSDPLIVSRGIAKKISPPPRGANVILITADTLRADHLGCYGSPYVRTPNLDRLAKEGVLFENHFSNANVTNPSHITILSSLYAKDHDVHDNTTPVSPHVTLLPERLRAQGFRTAAFTSVVHLNPPLSGLGQGFDDFSFSPLIERSAALTNRAVFSWLDEHGGEPFFLWIHYFDPHVPYTPAGPYHTLYDARLRKKPPEREWAERFRGRETLIRNLKEEVALIAENRAGREVLEKWLRFTEDGEFMALWKKSHPSPFPGGADPSPEAFSG